MGFLTFVCVAIVAWLVWRGVSKRSRETTRRGARAPSSQIAQSVPMPYASGLARLFGLSSADAFLVDRYGIEECGDGAYRCRGYRFPALAPALAYARRLHGDVIGVPVVASTAVAAPAAAGPSLSGAATADRALMGAFGITLQDSCYVLDGQRFPNLLEALGHARRLKAAEAKLPVVADERRQAPVAPQSVPAWIPLGETVAVGPVSVGGGLCYVGSARRTSQWGSEKSLIDPTLPIGGWAEDERGDTLPYWPSYRDLSPGARRTFLEWMARGRQKRIGVGYAFIFFYGLERRLFVDKATGEARQLAAEVERLRDLYSGDYSFEGYARRFLEAVDMLLADVSVRPQVSPRTGYGDFEIPLPVRRYLGARVAAGQVLDADDALLWVLGLPDSYLRTPGQRCFAELQAMWRVRFARRHPQGLAVRAPKRRLSGSYRSASGTIQVSIDMGDLPDIAAVAAPLGGLKDLLHDCQTELEAYSRLLGRRPEAKGTLEASLLLPDDLMDSEFGKGVAELRDELSSLIGDHGPHRIDVLDLIERLGLAPVDGKLTATVQRQAATVLDRLDIAFEPDRRYGDVSLAPDGEMVLFRSGYGCPVDADSPAYQSARTLVEVAALAAGSDGEVVSAELAQIEAQILESPNLVTPDRLRLSAFGQWLAHDRKRQKAAVAKLAKLPLAHRAGAAKAAVAAVLADNRVAPAEVRFLEILYKALGLPQDEVYAALHRAPARDRGPVTIAEAEPQAGVALPRERPAGMALDADRLARIRIETSEVSALLAGIFTEEVVAEAVEPAAAPSVDSMSRFTGLEGRHAHLLGMVAEQATMDRETFDAEARRLRLLPEGAIETINDWAFDQFDEPVLEGEESLALVEHLREHLRTLEMAA